MYKSRVDTHKCLDGTVCVKVAHSCPTLGNPMDYTVRGILQARILEWVAFPFFRGSSQPRDWTQVSRIVGGFFTIWATREPWYCLGAAFLEETLGNAVSGHLALGLPQYYGLGPSWLERHGDGAHVWRFLWTGWCAYRLVGPWRCLLLVFSSGRTGRGKRSSTRGIWGQQPLPSSLEVCLVLTADNLSRAYFPYVSPR